MGPDLRLLIGAARDPHLLAPILPSEISLCGAHATCYYLPNICIEIINVLLLGAMAYTFSSRKASIAAGAVALAIVSPFAAVFLYVPSGLEDGLSLTLFLALLWFIQSHHADQRPNSYIGVLVGFAVLVLQSPLYAGSCIFLMLWGRSRNWHRGGGKLFLVPLLLPILAIASRSVVAKSWEAAIAPPPMSSSLIMALLFVALAAFAFWPLALSMLASPAEKEQRTDSQYLWLALPIGIIASVVWSREALFSSALYPANLSLLLVACLVAGRGRAFRKPAFIAISCAVVVVGLLGLTPAIRRGGILRPQITLATAIRRGLSTFRGGANPVFIADHGDPVASRWTLAGSAFIRLYYHRNARVSYVATLPDSPAQIGNESPLIDITDNPANPRASLALSQTRRRGQRGDFNFIQSFALGKINDETAVTGTPTHRGAFVGTLADPLGALPIMTILGGYTYTFGAVAIKPGAQLTFAAANPLSVEAAINGEISIVDNGHRTIVWRAAFPGAGPDGPAWRAFAISLRRFTGHRVSVSFIASARPNNGSGAWLSFVDPVLETTPRIRQEH